MAKETNGVFQNKDNSWGFRFTAVIDGKQITKRKTKDENGQKFPTRKAAAKAREAAIAKAHIEVKQKQKIYRRTMADVFKEYCESGRTGKAYQTIKKQDSLWNNHISARFGKRYVDDISAAEIVDYLSKCWQKSGNQMNRNLPLCVNKISV